MRTRQQQTTQWRRTARATESWCKSIAAHYNVPVHSVRAWPYPAIQDEAARLLGQAIVRDAQSLAQMDSLARIRYRSAAKTDWYKARVIERFNRYEKKNL